MASKKEVVDILETVRDRVKWTKTSKPQVLAISKTLRDRAEWTKIWDPRLNMPQLTIRDVFDECQKGMHSHGKLVKSLTNCYSSTDAEEFFPDFVHHVKYSLIVYRREATVERTLDFAAKFVTSFVEKPEKKEEENEAEKEKEDEEEEGEEMHPFVLKFFNFLLQHHNAKEKAVRFRCCQMVNKLLNNMSEDAQIDDDLYDKIYECMLQRLRDKFPIIRVQAVLALSRLQDPHDMECPIIKAYLFLMSCDTNPDVRRAVLSVIAASTKTLAGILERTRDVKDIVRKLAYQIIAEKVHIRALTIAQRVRLLQEGLNDRVDVVKDACSSRMLQAWLRIFESSTMELLKALDVENSADTSQLALKTLFKKTPVSELVTNFDILNEDHVLAIEELTSEAVLYWRCLAEHIHSLGNESEEQLEKILPNGIAYSKFMTEVLSHMKGEDNIDIQLRNEFILQQLLTVADVMDLSDEVGRKHVLQVLKDMLLCEDVVHTLVKTLLQLYTKLVTDPDQRIQQLAELISDIRMPITVLEDTISAGQRRQIDLKLASVRVKLNQLRDELETAIQSQDFTKAAEIKQTVGELEESKNNLLNETQPQSQEVRTEKNDPATLLKCLTISREMMLHLTFRGLKPALQSLLETLILPGVTNADPAVRNVAVASLGLCCLMDKETARAHLLLFMQVSQIDVETVKVSALQIIFDILLTFGLDAFGVDASGEEADSSTTSNEDTSRDKSRDDFENSDSSMLANLTSTENKQEKDKENRANSILIVLISLLESQSSDVRTCAAEGLAKLMLSGRVLSPKLLSRLLLLWYNPVTEDDNQLRHCLGAFFPVYAFAGRGNPAVVEEDFMGNQAVVEEAFMLTLNTLFHAPATSPLAGVNISNVAELLVELTNSRHLVNNQGDNKELTQDTCSHDNIAVSVCNEILKEPNSFNVRALCHILTLLELCANNYTNLKDLKVLANDMAKEVKDKQCLKILEKFQKQVKALLTTATQNGLLTPGPIGTPAAHRTPVARREEVVESDTAATEDATQKDEGQEKENTNQAADETTADVTLLEDGKPDNRKHKKGKKALHSIIDTPVSADSRRTRPSKVSLSVTKDKKESETEAVEPENDDCFASPTPVRRTTRTRKTRTTSSTSAAMTATKINLEEVLPESKEGQEEEADDAATTTANTPVTRSTRSTRSRAKNKSTKDSGTRGPLNERNEVE